MIKLFLSLVMILFSSTTLASVKSNLIKNLETTDNLTFNFEQNINGKIENGNCIIQYPKKINCKYNLINDKILISNGKSLVIKTTTSYYLYPLKKTTLNLILNKDYLLNKIKNANKRDIDNKFINFTFIEENNELNIFFDKKNYNLVGWQTLDIYQNLSITFLSSVIKNQDLDESLFIIPNEN